MSLFFLILRLFGDLSSEGMSELAIEALLELEISTARASYDKRQE